MLEQFIDFFEHLTSLQKLLWIILCLTVFWVIEGAYPLARAQYNRWSHARPNLILLASTIIINVIFGLATVGIFQWTADHQFGIFRMMALPTWLELILAVMALDFMAQYVVHFLLHKVSFMWRFHMVHHSDTHVDVTTGTRHHPGDFVMRELFSLIAIFIFGMPLAFYLLYRILTVFFTYFSHANINMPPLLDRLISYVFISPHMHKFHHHFERPWTDTNYGNIFSFWDRIFGTLVYDDPRKILYGLDVIDSSKSDDIEYQLKVPFDKNIKTDY